MTISILIHRTNHTVNIIRKLKLFLKRIFISSSTSCADVITGNIPKETVGAPIIINNNGSISIIGIGIKLSGSTGELIVLPSAVFIETLSQLKKVEPIRNLIELAEAKNDDDLKYICARSAAAYEYAFKKQFEFADAPPLSES